ncbi:MAG: septum site-determining protein MinC [Gammaproteobacteria bacterium]
MDTVRTDKAETKDVNDNSNDSAIEIKGSVFTLPVLKICATETEQIALALKKHLAQSLSFFKNAPIVIDLERTKQLKPAIDFLALTQMLSAGAEVMADGNIHIYAPLRGRALAGVKGDDTARIFCHYMEAELIAIAGAYRVFEDRVPNEYYQKAVQICLRGEQLDIVPIQ